MTETIGALPFWQITFDAQGDSDAAALQTFVDEVGSRGLTDLVVFSHGWNNSQRVARRLYDAWFTTFANQLDGQTTSRPVSAGLVGVFWPSQRWSDEPIPDFEPAAAAGGGGGAAAAPVAERVPAPPPTIDEQTLSDLRESFPEGAAQLDRMAELLASEPTDEAVADFKKQLDAFAAATSVDDDDGEGEAQRSPGGSPGMLEDGGQELFERYVNQLKDSGVDVDTDAGGAAGLSDRFKGIWNGAKEALRQLTYWQMKNRAGVVGKTGLGPLIGRLQDAQDDLRVHLVGHSFGARLVSYTLAGLPAGDSPVKSVTLLQGAFSHFAFADPLPFDAGRKGGLAGKLSRIDGPLTVCFSEHDGAVGKFYPLASIVARDDSAAAHDRFYRWGGMGHDGAQGVSARGVAIQSAGQGASYPFATGKALNVDASEVVRKGGPPSGAHSDIVHTELTWIVLKAAQMV